MKRICVFCGSSPGSKASYTTAAIALGKEIIAQGIGLVYGGGNVGLMGEIANSVLEGGGEVIGVIPEALAKKEIAHRNLTELKVVNSMHERKALMADLSDAFIALPGGFGTFEEFFEVLTWTQLGLHSKPCGLLNVDGFYNPLLSLVSHAVTERFIRSENAEMIVVENEPQKMISSLLSWKPVVVPKWIDRSES